MTQEVQKALKLVNDTLDRAEIYNHACGVISFDQETICPPAAMERQGEVLAFLADKAFRMTKRRAFIDAAELLYAHRGELEESDAILAETLHRQYMREKNITPAMNHRFDLALNRSFVNWLKAKQADDYALFKPSLTEVRDIELKRIALLEEPLPEKYDNLLDQFERGMTSEKLDAAFGAFKARVLPLMHRIVEKQKPVRTDFLSRPVTDEQQRQMADWLLRLIGFDFERGALTTTEHPFTDSHGRNDTRVTTHFYANNFISNIYSVLHEGGHALFDQNFPREDYDHHIDGCMTMGQHESVSRFYENVIGRSEAFINLIFPKAKEIFPEVLSDVTPRELYEAVNRVQPSLVRLEADELTYTFHIIIRYELEKALVDGVLSLDDLPRAWSDKYAEYLGIRPTGDRDGVLQDMHWSGGFGYFPTYALGNMYNCMYARRMNEDFDLNAAIARGDFETINNWMREHTWKLANRQDAATWIQAITGRDFTPDDFADYLEAKYTALYAL